MTLPGGFKIPFLSLCSKKNVVAQEISSYVHTHTRTCTHEIIMRCLFSDMMLVLAQTGASTDNYYSLYYESHKIFSPTKGFILHTRASSFIQKPLYLGNCRVQQMAVSCIVNFEYIIVSGIIPWKRIFCFVMF